MKKIKITILIVIVNIFYFYGQTSIMPENWVESEMGYLVINKKGKFFASSKKFTLESLKNDDIELNLHKIKSLREIHFTQGREQFALVKYYYLNKENQLITFNYSCINEESFIIPVIISFKKNYKRNVYADMYCKNKYSDYYINLFYISPLRERDLKVVENIIEDAESFNEDYENWMNQR